MKILRQVRAQSKHFIVHLGSIMMSLLIVSFMPTTALAAPPATVATCQGIKDAYSILGTQCQNAYAIVNPPPPSRGTPPPPPDTPADRLAKFVARRTVMQIFRKAYLCNAMYGATSQALQVFGNGETGHVIAIKLLRASMEEKKDKDIPAAYTEADLQNIVMRKQQCT